MQQRSIYETEVVHYETTIVDLVIGDDVFNLLHKPTFRASWKKLYDNCKWGTVFQSWEFVFNWYQTYKSQYLPILVFAEKGNTLTGILAMALSTNYLRNTTFKKVEGRIIGAGQYEAEYQTWLADETDSGEFIKDALKQISICFPKCNIVFRFLPSQVPLDSVLTDPYWRKKTVVHSCDRPLMDFSSPDLKKLFSKNEFRNKCNRLKKLGDLKFEHVTDRNRFEEILPELSIQYDFRQGAMFNKNQFRDNPLKADFLLTLFDQNLLHVTVLKVNEEILSSIVALAGKNWVHLGGINTHSPFYAGYYSPGFVHFIMLGQHLAQDGISVFDLTPGGDSYKKRMATNNDQVYELTISSNSIFKLKREIRKQIYIRLERAGIWPMGFELLVKKKLYNLKALRVKKILRYKAQRLDLLRRKNESTYEFQLDKTPISTLSGIQKNNLSDLLNYDQRVGSLTRWEFLEDAMRRFEDGEICYSYCINGRLVFCIWLNKLKNKINAAEPSTDFYAVLQSIYYDTSCHINLKDFFLSVSHKVFNDLKISTVYSIVDKQDNACSEILDDIGILVDQKQFVHK